MKHVFRLSVCAAFVGFGLSACVTPGSPDAKPGSALTQRLSSDQHAATLDKRSLRKAVAAEIRALETAAPGTLVSWKGSKGSSGGVRPGQAFEVSGRTCRQFEHAIIIGGTTRVLSATACQREKGDWEPLT